MSPRSTWPPDTVGGPIIVGTNPDAIAITPNGATAYVANDNDGTVTPIDLAANTAGTPITVGTQPNAIAITPDGTTAEVVNFDDDTVTPIDTATNTAGHPDQRRNRPVGHRHHPRPGPGGRPVGHPGQRRPGHRLQRLGLGRPVVAHRQLRLELRRRGTPPTRPGPTTTHTYAHQGTYTATVTETDADGTSLTKVFTGQTMSRNGGPQAETSLHLRRGRWWPTPDPCTGVRLRDDQLPDGGVRVHRPPSSIDAGGTFQTAPASRSPSPPRSSTTSGASGPPR